MEGSEDAGITVSHDFGLEFPPESTQSDPPSTTQTKKLIITIANSSPTPHVTFEASRVCSPDDSVTE